MDSFAVCHLGRIDYAEALKLQERLVTARQHDQLGDTLLILEHPPVLTLGTRGQETNIYLSSSELEVRGVSIHHVNRGGDVTYHGPGQIVAYPIFKLEGIREFVAQLQNAIITMLFDEYAIESEARSGKMTGVWIGDRKIAAIGLAVRHGISMHGFAFNINTDLSHFSWINPCGLSMGVTSLASEIGHPVDFAQANRQITDYLAASFGRPFTDLSRQKLNDNLGGSDER